MTPGFNPSALMFVEQGGIYCVANLRGGSEYGEAWHKAGMLADKQNGFCLLYTAEDADQLAVADVDVVRPLDAGVDAEVGEGVREGQRHEMCIRDRGRWLRSWPRP